MTTPTAPDNNADHKVSNFLRQIIEKDLEQGTYASRRWAGSPGDAAHHAAGEPDPARIRTELGWRPSVTVEQGLEREREMKSRAQQLNLMRAKSVGKDCKLISPTTQAVRQRLKEESERNMLIQQQMLQQSHMEWLQRKKQIRGKDQKRLDKEVEDRRRILAQVSMEEKELERRLLSKENKVLEQRRRLIEMFDP